MQRKDLKEEKRTIIEVRHLTKKFSKQKSSAVNDVSFTINSGEFITLLGTSGSGKTTLLKMINRLCEPSSGEIIINGENVLNLKPELLRRQIGYVIQQHGLFEHWTVEQNVATVCKILKWNKIQTSKRVNSVLELVQLKPEKYKKRHPHQLSGGEQQRVGIARALAADPKILLMDEPFGAIDAINRTLLQDEIKKIQRKTKKTIIFVTHDIEEALKLGDRIMIFKDGKIQQFANKNNLFLHPNNNFIKEFLKVDDLISEWKYLNVGSLVKKWFNFGDNKQFNDFKKISSDDILVNAVSFFLKNPSKRMRVIDHNRNVEGQLSLSDFNNYWR